MKPLDTGECRMKISKKRLQQIIKEERARLLMETQAETEKYELYFEEVANKIATMFGDDMRLLRAEDPGLQTTYTQIEWDSRVHDHELALHTAIEASLAGAFEEHEQALVGIPSHSFVDDPTEIRRARMPADSPPMWSGIKTSSFE